MEHSTAGITARTADWAKSHDWFVCAAPIGDGRYVVVCETVAVHLDGRRTLERARFTNRAELRAWAGY